MSARDDALRVAQEAHETWGEASSRLDRLAVHRRLAWHAAVDLGVTRAELARACGVAPATVTRQLALEVPAGTLVEREENECAVTVTPDTATVDAEPATEPAAVLSHRVTVGGYAKYGRRVSAFVDTRVGHAVTDLGDRFAVPPLWGPVSLLVGLRMPVDRVYLCGPMPEAENGVTRAERVRAWFLDTRGLNDAGWEPGAHYLADPDTPVGRWKHKVTQRVVEVHHAQAWHGDDQAGVQETRAAWLLVQEAIGKAFWGGQLLATPATTGRDLWLRSAVKRDGTALEYSVLSDELRELIRATSGQGRVELRPRPVAYTDDPPCVRGFAYLDGVLMYAGLTWGMPYGEPRWWTGAQARQEADFGAGAERLFRSRGRWRVAVTVPDDWSHVGLLPARAAGRGWCYPSEPGRKFTTWADGAEVWTAMLHGWRVEPLEGFTMPESKALNVWTERLVNIWRDLGLHGPGSDHAAASRLARRMVRSLILFSIGAFAAGPRTVTRSCSLDANAPAGVRVEIVGERQVWQEREQESEWSAGMAHPEWAATIWARARVRLLDGPGQDKDERTGALHVPASDVIGFATDALYLANDPGWSHGVDPGRFRVKGRIRDARPWPASWAALHALRDEAAQS